MSLHLSKCHIVGNHMLRLIIMFKPVDKEIFTILHPAFCLSTHTGLQIFFKIGLAKVTHGAKKGEPFSEMMGPSISN